MNNFKYYTGIGSRETPPETCSLIRKIAVYLLSENYILRSGGADGADISFSSKIPEDKKQIFLPWNGFNDYYDYKYPLTTNAYKVAEKFHPAWDRCSNGVKKLHTRNVYQVLGYNLESPSEFIVCWTKGGRMVGGTAQALRVSQEYNIKIYNLAIEKDKKYWEEKIGKK